MKLIKLFRRTALVAVIGCSMAACASKPAVNPETNPNIDAKIRELFSLDPDKPDEPQPVATIAIKHPVDIKDWAILIQPSRSGQAGQGAAGQAQARPAGGEARPAGERPAGEAGQRQSRGPFFEQKGTGNPPKEWKWNGKSSRPSGELVQSATDYQFSLTVNDIFDNTATYEGILSVDVLVRRDGENLRIIVPSIVFPPNSADFKLLSEDDMRGNRRVFRLIGNALNKYSNYNVDVEGHSNPTTPPDTPQRATEETRELKPISEARAKAVVDYLVENQSVDRSRLNPSGVGGVRTVANYDDSDENWKNRRVEFILRK